MSSRQRPLSILPMLPTHSRLNSCLLLLPSHLPTTLKSATPSTSLRFHQFANTLARDGGS